MKWILFSDKKPDLDKNGHSDNVIVFNGKDVIDDCNYIPEYGGFVVHAYGYDYDSYIVQDVTHWMELPKPPIA
jgi:hypothetical protein